ncbi:MAG: hypothetical protein ABIA02_03305 [Candidatus Falkowbacteria bacterium]
MFNIFNKKNKEEVKKEITVDEFKEENAKEHVEEENDIAIHSMPEKFRVADVQLNNPKKTGMLIIIGGAVLLIAVSIGLYFYLFSGQESVNIVEEAITEKEIVNEDTSTALSIDKEEEQPESVYNKIIAKPEIEIATSAEEMDSRLRENDTGVATSTPAIISLPSADSDIDGLSNKEENILGSNLTKADSDGDGYSDLSELINLYNPAGEGKLIDNKNISQYLNSSFNYNLLYPASWSISSVGGDESIVFKSSDNQFVQIISQINESKETIEDWYKRNFNTLIVNNNRKIMGDTWQGVKSEDGLIIYLTGNLQNSIITITYTTGEGNILDYINIFEMMVNSLEI